MESHDGVEDWQPIIGRMKNQVCWTHGKERDMKQQRMKRFDIGTTVTNFGQQARVVGYHGDDYILEDPDGLRWIADPEKCEEVKA